MNDSLNYLLAELSNENLKASIEKTLPHFPALLNKEDIHM